LPIKRKINITKLEFSVEKKKKTNATKHRGRRGKRRGFRKKGKRFFDFLRGKHL